MTASLGKVVLKMFRKNDLNQTIRTSTHVLIGPQGVFYKNKNKNKCV